MMWEPKEGEDIKIIDGNKEYIGRRGVVESIRINSGGMYLEVLIYNNKGELLKITGPLDNFKPLKEAHSDSEIEEDKNGGF